MRSLPVVVLSAALLSACGGVSTAGSAASPPGPSAPATPSSSLAPTTPPTVAPGAEPAATPTAGPTATRTVYWLGATDDPRGPRLYRELVPLPDGGDAVRDAVVHLLAGAPEDPDYDSLWAAGTQVLSVRRDGSTAVVDLSSEARTHGGGAAFEQMTLQQLVHTVTAA